MGNQTFLKATMLMAFMLSTCLCVFGQGTTSRVTGTVTDNTGAVVAGATVTLTNEATNVSLTTTTSSTGQYVFDLIQAGRYSVTVERDGFKKFVSTRNNVLINQPATVNVSLEVGDVSVVVSVEASAEVVQTSSSGNIGGTVEQRTIESLPIVGTRGRNPLDILNFQPGVTTGANTGGGVHINGSRDRSFNFTLDGIDINESTAGGSNFTPLRTNPDSLQEFQIVTSGFTAELGRSSGAQVTFVTRSGTNQFRGSVFEYYQSKGFHANSYAGNVNGTAKANFIQHIFGGSFGGPLFSPFGTNEKPVTLLRDKAFFFVNLQMLRANDALLQTRSVYTQSVRNGIYRWVRGGVNGPGAVDAAGNPIRPACVLPADTNCIDSYNIAAGTGISLDPVILGYINRAPLPNSFSASGDGLNQAAFLFNSPQTEEQYDFVSKFDFKINETNSFYVRYAQGEQNTIGDGANAGRPRFPDPASYRVDTFRTPKNLAINWRTSPTARFTNEFIFGWSKFGFSFNNANPDPNHQFILNVPTDFNLAFTYNARSFRTLQFVDNMTFDLSPHVIKAGANIRLGRSNDDRASVAGGGIDGTFNFSRTINNNFNFPGGTPLPTGAAMINSADRTRLENVINDLLGRVGQISQAFVNDPNNPGQFAPAGSRWNFDADHPEIDFYVQDTWKWRPNFTVDLGLRWEIRLAPRAASGRPILVPDRSVTLGSPASNNIRWTEGELFNDNYGVFLPTVGFAWDPFGDGKTSVRLNYRKASDRFSTFLFSSFIFQSTPGNTALGTNTLFGQNGGLLREGLPSVVPTGSPDTLRTPPAYSSGSIAVIDPDIKFPSIHNWTASFQREFWGRNVFEFNYIGKKATNLFGAYNANQVDINATLPGQTGTFLDAFNAVRGGSNNVPYINFLMSGDPTNDQGTVRFRALNSTAVTQGSVATLALAVSQRFCLQVDVNAGLCSAAQLGQRLLDLRGLGGLFQPFSQFTGGLNIVDSNDFSFYNGLEFIVKRRFNQGVSFQVGYTYAISKDTRSFDPTFTVLGTGSTGTSANTPFDNANRAANYAWSDFDRRHSVLGTYVVELPFGNGKKFSTDNSVMDYIIGGWQLAGSIRLTSGRPFSAFSGLNTVSQTSGSFANCDGCPRDLGGLTQGNFENTSNPNTRNWWFTDTQRDLFSQPEPGEIGNTGRNYFIGPGYTETDISLSRKFRVNERYSFDIRVDARNLTNTPNFAAPSSVLPAGFSQSGFGSSIFGRINTSVTNNARRIQVSGKFNF